MYYYVHTAHTKDVQTTLGRTLEGNDGNCDNISLQPLVFPYITDTHFYTACIHTCSHSELSRQTKLGLIVVLPHHVVYRCTPPTPHATHCQCMPSHQVVSAVLPSPFSTQLMNTPVYTHLWISNPPSSTGSVLHVKQR